MNNNQQGFTLIELMVSLVLGAMVSAAALTVFLVGQRSQELSSALLSTANAASGIETLADRIEEMDSIDFLSKSTKHQVGSNLITTATNYGYGMGVSTNNISQDQVGASLTNLRSDQLVFRYSPKYSGGYDCEGGLIANTTSKVIERYYVEHTLGHTHLYCDAGRVVGATFTGMGVDPVVIIPNVAHFHVSLDTTNMDNTASTQAHRVHTIARYKDYGADHRVSTINIGLLLYSENTIGHRGLANADKAFPLFERRVVINTNYHNAANQYVYTPIVRSISLSSNF